MTKKEKPIWKQPIYTQEQRLGECMLLLCGRNPAFASAVQRAFEKAGLSNGGKIIEERLKMHGGFQQGLPIVGQENL